MIIYSQVDPKWKDLKIGNTKMTIGSEGCYLTCISMIAGQTPDVVNNILTRHGGYNIQGLILNDRAAQLLKMTYKLHTTPYVVSPSSFPIICETNHYWKLSYPQHFYILVDKSTRIDPLDKQPKPEPNTYNQVSFREFIKSA